VPDDRQLAHAEPMIASATPPATSASHGEEERPTGALSRAGAYMRLGKFQIYEHWLPALVAFSALARPADVSPGAALTLAFIAAAAACFAAAGSALDDVQGIRDGIDRLTYNPQESQRNIRGKPLLLGELGEREATRFATGCALAGALAIAGMALVAPHAPFWLIGTFAVLALAATQYSYGLKLSYRGIGELLLAVANAATLAIAYGLAAGQLPVAVLCEVMLLGFWMAQITVFSSVADVEHDRAAGRTTAVAMLDDRAHGHLIGAIFLTGWTLTVAALAAGALPPVLALGLLPAWWLQARQLRAAFRDGGWLRARRLGWRAYDLGVLAIVGANLLSLH
jgi:1,4-dihydroxy-2-naphthoate octaprenyltransferase